MYVPKRITEYSEYSSTEYYGVYYSNLLEHLYSSRLYHSTGVDVQSQYAKHGDLSEFDVLVDLERMVAEDSTPLVSHINRPNGYFSISCNIFSLNNFKCALAISVSFVKCNFGSFEKISQSLFLVEKTLYRYSYVLKERKPCNRSVSQKGILL